MEQQFSQIIPAIKATSAFVSLIALLYAAAIIHDPSLQQYHENVEDLSRILRVVGNRAPQLLMQEELCRICETIEGHSIAASRSWIPLEEARRFEPALFLNGTTFRLAHRLCLQAIVQRQVPMN